MTEGHIRQGFGSRELVVEDGELSILREENLPSTNDMKKEIELETLREAVLLVGEAEELMPEEER